MTARTARRRSSRRRARRGFTLVEILVALLAGLIVAISVMALSREATRTFHEEVRSAAAQAAARGAIDRLRADLQRAAFMSTPNIHDDPSLAHAPGTRFFDRIDVARTGLRRLSGVRLLQEGSKTSTDALSSLNGLAPDAIEISGNFTTTDQFVVRYVAEPGATGCQRVWLALDSPPIYRLGTSSTLAAALRQAFQPAPATSTARFMARIVDDTGHAQFAATCPSANAAGLDSGVPYVDLEVQSSDSYAILSAKQTQTLGGAAGLGVGRMTINPVQTVRWELTSAPETQYAAGLNPTADNTKYDLVRTFVDANGAKVAGTEEVVAEYAVDLKFGFTVESSTVAQAAAGETAHTVLALEHTDNATWGKDVSSGAAGTGPQRIRSVRVRLVTRAEYPDRSATIAVSPPNASGEHFLYRYCVGATSADCTSGLEVWARARTLTTEVHLPNQQRAFF